MCYSSNGAPNYYSPFALRTGLACPLCRGTRRAPTIIIRWQSTANSRLWRICGHLAWVALLAMEIMLRAPLPTIQILNIVIPPPLKLCIQALGEFVLHVLPRFSFRAAPLCSANDHVHRGWRCHSTPIGPAEAKFLHTVSSAACNTRERDHVLPPCCGRPSPGRFELIRPAGVQKQPACSGKSTTDCGVLACRGYATLKLKVVRGRRS